MWFRQPGYEKITRTIDDNAREKASGAAVLRAGECGISAVYLHSSVILILSMGISAVSVEVSWIHIQFIAGSWHSAEVSR